MTTTINLLLFLCLSLVPLINVVQRFGNSSSFENDSFSISFSLYPWLEDLVMHNTSIYFVFVFHVGENINARRRNSADRSIRG